MKFWDREEEKKHLKGYLKSEPNAILFVYGPKSSGKSTLLMKVLDELKGELYTYYYDLRLVPVSGYKEVLRIFFRERGWRERLKKAIPEIASATLKYFEIDGKVLEDMFEMKLNPFEVMENAIRGRKSRNKKKPVIVFDELQKLKEVYVNGGEQRPLVRELFNFFVRLTKVLHLSHVIVMSSDTFFIEEVYSDSTLKNCSRYYLVDYFDDEVAYKVLVNEGVEEEEAKEIVERAGGVPWILEEIVESEDPMKELGELQREAYSKLINVLAGAKEEGWLNEAEEVLRKVINDEIDIISDRKKVERLVQKEILFYDPINVVVRFQTRLDELAARELLKEGAK